jgi:adenylate cyclase
MSQVKRRLAAILCADAVQYSRLMEADEDGTLHRLRACREAIGGLVAAHDGRIVNTWGDAVIVEFASVIEAVRCAVEIQDELARRNEALPAKQRMVFRIGLNLGDVMVDGDDIYGDGVNIAARLQQIAEPGGIVISATVYDQVKTKLALGFERLGVQSVKNLSEPVDTYLVRIGGGNAVPHGEGAAPGGWESDARGFGGAAREPDASGAAVFLDWYHAQGRRVRLAVGGIAFFFLLNLFSGFGHIWFQWPSLPFILMLLLGVRRRAKQ